MKIKKTTQWFCLCTLTAALTGGLVNSATAFQDASHPTAEQLYLDGTQLFDQGHLLEAKEMLERVDLAQLERSQRTDVIQRLDEINNQLAKMPEPELRLRKAQLFFARGDLRQASQHAAKVTTLEASSAEQIDQANNLLQQITTRQQELTPQIPTLLEQSFQAYEDGNYGRAKSGLQFVYNSGVPLDLDQQARLNRYLQKIYELEAVRGEFNATTIQLGSIQPAEQPTEQPAEEKDDQGQAEESDDKGQAEENDDKGQPEENDGDLTVDDWNDEAVNLEQPAEESNEQPEQETNESVVEQPEDQQPAEQPTEQPAEAQPQEDQIDLGDLIRQAQLARAAELLQQAQADRDAGRYAEALAKYKSVLAIQPDNQEAIEGRDFMATRLDQAEQGILNRQIVDRKVQAAAILAEFDNYLQQATTSRDQGSFDRALTMVTQAQVLLDQNRNFLSQPEYEQRRDAAAALAGEIKTQEREAALAEAQQQEEEIAKRRNEQRMQLELERQRKISEKLIAIRRLQIAQKYDEALLELKALLFLDPGNPAAQALNDVIQDLKLYQEFDKLKADQSTRFAEDRIESLKASRPPREVVEYPEDWPELSIIRQNGLAFLDSDQDRQVYQALASKHVPVDFQGVPFEKAIQFVADVAGVNADVDWNSLEQNFIDRNTPINLKLNDSVSLRIVLDRMLKKLGRDDESRPQYAITDGILTISTKEKLQQNKLTHLYDIRDLLVDVPDFNNAPRFDLEGLIRNENTTGLEGQTFGDGDETNYEKGISKRREMIDNIKRVITTNIDKLSWEVNGGDTGVIQEINGNLVITTTPRNHRQVSNLLEKLREIRAIQINVESRFLLVSEDFFEQIGFDLDVFYGGGPFRDAKKTDPNLIPSDLFVDPITGDTTATSQRQFISLFDLVGQVDANGNPVFDGQGRQVIQQVLPDAGIFQQGRPGTTPQSLQQNSLGLASGLFGADGQSFAGQALAATPALTYGVSYLDNIQVDLLIQATQADRRSIQLTAPKLTFFNGQRSFVQITTSKFFVSDLQPVVGTASAGFDPTLSPLREGVVLDVEGTVSADRRYVTMTVLTTLAKILKIETTELPIAVGGTVVGSGNDQNQILTNTAFIERPEIQISRVNTTVTVPDRGTILLGGQSVRNDIEIETGVPVLSKIPVLNRFFTNRITSTEERTLYILLRPMVIIQQENEDRLFPGLQDALSGTSDLGSQF